MSVQTLRVLIAWQPARAVLGAGLTYILEWRERARQRDLLAGLDDRMLRDIGLTRADVMCEASKPFWRA